MPPGGVPLAEYFGEARARQMAGYLVQFAAGFGVTGLVVGDRIPNTTAPLAVAEFARDQGRLHPFRRAAMEAYWRRGQDLEQPATLSACAEAAGRDPALALAAAADPAYLARVEAMGAEARRAGVTGIPTLLVGKRRVVGCQPYPVLAAAAEAEGAVPSSR